MSPSSRSPPIDPQFVVDPFEPAYRSLSAGEISRRVEAARQELEDCSACPRDCHANRTAGATGICHTGRYARVSSIFPHFGEEDCLRGWGGSGTIFFSCCNMKCQYCQNHDLSHGRAGQTLDVDEIAGMMLHLQNMGCHNINLVSPSHVVAQFLEALAIGARRGLRLPIVYNTGGYDSAESLALLDGVVDIYMPDMKYGDSQIARKYSLIPDYVEHNQAAVREMHRQVGDLVLDQDGIARRGLLVRHLVLPEGLAGTREVARFLANEVSKDTYINIMGQYRPEYKVRRENIAPLNRPVTVEEMAEAYRVAKKAGLHRFDQRRHPAWSLF